MQALKDLLVKLGPDSTPVQIALRRHARKRHFDIAFPSNQIHISRHEQLLILSKTQFVQVPFMIENFDLYFSTMEHKREGQYDVLNFSSPGLHRYLKSGIEFYFPSVPEDDVMDAYTFWHTPQDGEIVWDVGAHAGASSYYFSLMVGPSGKIIAFEPDEVNSEFLLRNIERHKLQNVVPVSKALCGKTGVARFNMDGSMSAGLSDYLLYTDKKAFRDVETITLADACQYLGSVPQFVKMDIEGAEADVIANSRSFLEQHPIHFSIESNHKVKGELTYKPLERLFREIGYKVHSSDQFGQMFTWAAPVR
jgi:FkbM family methyltransferase